jgi:hypothetical protein
LFVPKTGIQLLETYLYPSLGFIDRVVAKMGILNTEEVIEAIVSKYLMSAIVSNVNNSKTSRVQMRIERFEDGCSLWL